MLALVLALQEGEFERLVRALDADDVGRRTRAAASLETLLLAEGPKALERLAGVAGQGSAEVRARIEALRATVQRVEECRRRLRAFEALELPDCRGRTFAVHNTGDSSSFGERMQFTYSFGWLLPEKSGEPTMLDYSLLVEPLRRDLDLPEKWETFKKHHPPDRPLPGKTLPLDFEPFCKQMVEAVQAGEAPHESEQTMGIENELAPAVLAWWALQRGLPLLAVELEACALQAVKRLPENKEAVDLATVLGPSLARLRRHQAIDRASRGAPRSEVVKLWKDVIKSGPKPQEEAEELAGLYEGMIREDGAWKRPAPAAFAALPRSEQAKRWLRGLRDLHTTHGYPVGDRYLFQAPSEPTWRRADQELYRLGWDALPLLIDHLGDRRPTRITYSLQNDQPLLLLRVGDCCRMLFEAITGHSIFKPTEKAKTLVRDGDPAEAQRKARAWLEDKRKLGEEAFYLAALESEDRLSLAAAHLPRIDSARNLPRLLDLFQKGSPERKDILLPSLLPFLGKPHQKFLEGVLELDPTGCALMAAQALWTRCGSDQGARKVLALLRAGRMAEQSQAYEFLAEVNPEWAVDAACERVSSEDPYVRRPAMEAASLHPSRRTAEALLGCLGRKDTTGHFSTYELRECDFAAEGLIDMLQLSKKIVYKGVVAERDAKIVELKAWWQQHRDGLDWAELREKMKEQIKRWKLELEAHEP